VAESNWDFTQVHLEEIKFLANAGTRKSKNQSYDCALSGNAISVYINLRGRCYANKSGFRKFYTWASQIGIAKDLGWDPKKPKNRVSEAVRQLRDAGAIKVWNKEDRDPEAVDLRRRLRCGWSTTLYELTLFKEIYHQQASDSNQTPFPAQSEAPPVSIGPRSDSNRNKEEELNNKNEEDYSIINNEEEDSEERKDRIYREFMKDHPSQESQDLETIQRILDSDWNLEWVWEELHYEDVIRVTDQMKPDLKVVEDLRRKAFKLALGID